MRTFLKHSAALLFLAAAFALPASAPAAAASSPAPCWQKLMNQWYSGEIKTIFPLNCYHEAIKHLPTDIQVYSSARDDITRALQAAIAYDAAAKAASQTTTTAQTTTSSTPPPTTTTKHLVVPVIKTHGPGSGGAAAIPLALNSASPGGTTSFPLPLIILGGLAILLVAAGGVGLFVRRRQSAGPDTA
jgi:hypothetical protein